MIHLDNTKSSKPSESESDMIRAERERGVRFETESDRNSLAEALKAEALRAFRKLPGDYGVSLYPSYFAMKAS